MYTHIHIYTHTPLLKDKKSWPCFITFLSQTKIPLPKNKQKKWIFIFFQNSYVCCLIFCLVSASKLICISQAPPQSGNCNSVSWCTYNQDKMLCIKTVGSADVTSFMDFLYLQSILDFSFIQAILHCKTTPSSQFLNFPLFLAFMKNSFQNTSNSFLHNESTFTNINFTDSKNVGTQK